MFVIFLNCRHTTQCLKNLPASHQRSNCSGIAGDRFFQKRVKPKLFFYVCGRLQVDVLFQTKNDKYILILKYIQKTIKRMFSLSSPLHERNANQFCFCKTAYYFALFRFRLGMYASGAIPERFTRIE